MFVYDKFCYHITDEVRQNEKDIKDGKSDIHRSWYVKGKKLRDEGYAPIYIQQNYKGEERDMMLMGWQYRNWQYDNGEV